MRLDTRWSNLPLLRLKEAKGGAKNAKSERNGEKRERKQASGGKGIK